MQRIGKFYYDLELEGYAELKELLSEMEVIQKLVVDRRVQVIALFHEFAPTEGVPPTYNFKWDKLKDGTRVRTHAFLVQNYNDEYRIYQSRYNRMPRRVEESPYYTTHTAAWTNETITYTTTMSSGTSQD